VDLDKGTRAAHSPTDRFLAQHFIGFTADGKLLRQTTNWNLAKRSAPDAPLDPSAQVPTLQVLDLTPAGRRRFRSSVIARRPCAEPGPTLPVSHSLATESAPTDATREAKPKKTEYPIHIIGLKDDRPRATFVGHQGRALAVAESPDGQMLASAGEDRTSDSGPGHLRRTGRMGGAQGAHHGLGFSSHDQLLCSGDGDGVIKLWDLAMLRRELTRLGLDWRPVAETAEAPGRHRYPLL